MCPKSYLHIVTTPKPKKPKLPKYVQLRQGKWFIRRAFASRDRDEQGHIKYVQIVRRITPETPEQAKLISDQIESMYRETQAQRSRPLIVSELVKECIDAKRTGVEKKTDDYYQWMYKKYVKSSTFGQKLAKDVTPRDVQAFYKELPTPLMVRKVHIFLNMSFRQGVRWELIKRNPCEGVLLPKVARTEIKIMSESEAKKFQKFCLKKYPVLAFAMESWCRPSEYLALRWSDVDLEKKQVRINRAVSFTYGGGYSFVPTKTAAGKRTIGITDTMAKLLASLPRTSDLVFPNRKGTPQNPTNLANRTMVKACIEAEIEAYSPYVLRHTGASIALAHGANLTDVSRRLGHQNVSITLNVYSHVLERSTVETVKIIAGALY